MTRKRPLRHPSAAVVEELPDAAAAEFLRYFDGEMAAGERDRFQQRLDADGELGQRFAEWRRAGDMLRARALAHAEPDWAHFHAALDEQIDAIEAPRVVPLADRWRRRSREIAAVLALAAGIAAVVFAVSWASDHNAPPAIPIDPLADAAADADPGIVTADAAAEGAVRAAATDPQDTGDPDMPRNLVDSIESVDSSVMISNGDDQTTTVIWVFEH